MILMDGKLILILSWGCNDGLRAEMTMIKNDFLAFEVGLLKVLFLRMAGLLGFCFRGCAGSCFGLSAQICSNTPCVSDRQALEL